MATNSPVSCAASFCIIARSQRWYCASATLLLQPALLPDIPNALVLRITKVLCRHFAFNMLALWSFGVTTATELGVNQFLGFYLSAGLASALLSDLGRFRSLKGGRSLGASGAVYACFALVALTMPETEVRALTAACYPRSTLLDTFVLSYASNGLRLLCTQEPIMLPMAGKIAAQLACKTQWASPSIVLWICF